MYDLYFRTFQIKITPYIEKGEKYYTLNENESELIEYTPMRDDTVHKNFKFNYNFNESIITELKKFNIKGDRYQKFDYIFNDGNIDREIINNTYEKNRLSAFLETN